MQLSGSIVLSKLQLEQDSYQIISSAEDLSRFCTKNKMGETYYEVSPKELKIEVYKNDSQDPVNFEESFGFYCVTRSDQNLANFLRFGDFVIENEESGEVTKINTHALYFQVEDFLNSDGIEQGFLDHDIIFKFEYKKGNEVVASKAFQLRSGISAEMANFNITAASINASIENSKMSFTENGLEIKNGGLVVKNKDDKQIFGFETTTINEVEVSTLAIRGMVYAEGGEFVGKIHATQAEFEAGEIGGFIIENGQLVSKNKTAGDSTLKLDGESGLIIANNIKLGIGAEIDDYIRLGNAYLYNPKKNNNKILESGNIIIEDNGKASFGNIQINGEESTLRGQNWFISNTEANFSNVNVSGAIETSVFKNNTVQAVGGAMIFRPSYKGEYISGNFDSCILKLESKFQGVLNSKVQVLFVDTADSYVGVISRVFDNNVEIKALTENGFKTTTTSEIILIDYGQDQYDKVTYYYPIYGEDYYLKDEKDNYFPINIEQYYKNLTIKEDYLINDNLVDAKNDSDFLSTNGDTILVENNQFLINSIQNFYTRERTVLIGINSGNSATGIDGRILPKGLTLTSLEKEDKFVPNLYLGDLKKIGYTGYGLYADNVFLTGSLTTKSFNDTYTGVNTSSQVPATIFVYDEFDKGSFEDNSNIVFWAGAESYRNEDIQCAPFQVTEKGSVYMQNAKITGSIFSNGLIRSADIYTARLHGSGDYGEIAALTIYDTYAGISFKQSYKDDEKECFKINSDGFYTNNKKFISIETFWDQETEAQTNIVNFIGKKLQSESENVCLSLETNKEYETINGHGWYINSALKFTQNGIERSGLYFKDSLSSFKYNINGSMTSLQDWQPNEVIIHNVFTLEEQNYQLKYKPSSLGGYDLYVSNKQE